MSMQKNIVRAQNNPVKIPKFVSILIVDDERYDRARLRRICDNLDFEASITEAASLEAMGTALGHDKFDLIFLDFNMPDGNGLLALDAIQFDDRNRFAAIIMVTGEDDTDIAITAMKNGCSDFIKKESVSQESVRRATINALQKAGLNRGLEIETNMRTNVETVLDQFTKQCANEFHPMLFNMMRHVRSLHAVRLNQDKYISVVRKIEDSCERLFDFVIDIDDKERKDCALLNADEIRSRPTDATRSLKQDSKRATLFGSRST